MRSRPIDAEQLTTQRQVAAAMLRYGGPRILLLSVSSAWAVRSMLGPVSRHDALFVVATLACWPMLEWLVHRKLQHVNPMNREQRRFETSFSRRHRQHHRDPARVEIAVVPTRVAIIAMLNNALLAWLLLGPTPMAATAIATVASMTLLHEWTHVLVHSAYAPLTWPMRRLRRNHRLHHFHNERYWMAFTNPLADYIMGTHPDPSAVRPTKTCMDLYGMHRSGIE